MGDKKATEDAVGHPRLARVLVRLAYHPRWNFFPPKAESSLT